MQERATAVLLNYRRPENLTEIISSLLDEPFVERVLVWNNGEYDRIPAEVRENHFVEVFSAGRNIYTYGRFVLPTYASDSDWIMTQDDDYVVRNWREIWASKRPDRITACLDEAHLSYHDPRHRWQTAHEVLLGWGAVFPRHLAKPTLARYIDVHGYDEILRRKADRLFSILLNREHIVLPADVSPMPGVREPFALYRQPDHLDLNREARKRALSILGLDHLLGGGDESAV